MPGEWLYKKSRDHVCAKPGAEPRTAVGDIWRCECGKMWIVKNFGSDPRPGEGGWLEWNEYAGAVPKQKTVGVTAWRDR